MEVSGSRIRSERERHGWDQAELAKRLGGVTQQTISRWERGRSRPRREMVARLATLFEVSVRELLAEAGRAPADPPRPVRPRLVNLPLAELTADQFEHFVADLAQMLYPDAHVSRYGTQGHTQHGIDVLVQDGRTTRATLQCKRHRTFGPQQVREAVGTVTVTAQEHFLVLSRPASPGARQEMANHPSWTLLDAEDLSRRVRSQLSRDQAVRLVDIHFPGWREPLLGVLEPGVWQTTQEFYRLSSRGDFYSHKWALVGRQAQVKEVASFVESEAGGGLALVVGRGGIGKTRLLREIADSSEAHRVAVRFLSTSTTVQPQQFELLPTVERLLVIIDDVHERNDVAELVSNISRNRPTARILLSLRPYGLSQLSSQLRHVGLHASNLPTWDLSDLATADAELLAREVLGVEVADTIVRRLAQLTTDCPLITVVGAILIARGLLDPVQLESDDSIRSEILRAFRDALVADPLDGNSDLRRGVLEGIAVLQPLRIDDSSFQSALATLTGSPFDRAVSHIRALEDAGVILRRGRALRIVPDLLGDVVLAGAALDERSGVSTGYIERARAAAEGAALQHVFLNASRVDWQVRRHRRDGAALAESLWADLETEHKEAGIRGREALLSLLEKVAFYQPDRALPLMRWTIDHPTNAIEDVDDDLIASLYTPSYDDVLHKIPPILKAVAYNFEYFAFAVDILWELAQADARPTNQHPEHAIRALQDLASYEPGKPLVYNAAMVDAAERWNGQMHGEDWVYSPFDVLEQLFATEGTEQSSDGRAISIRPFAINVESTDPVRQRVVELALQEATSFDVKRSTRAVEALENALRYPSGLFGRPVPDDEREKWTPRFVALIKSLGELVTRPGIDPVLGIAIRKALNWHAEHSSDETGDAARTAVAKIPRTIPFEIALALYDGWGHLIVGRWTNYEKMEAAKQARFDAIAEEVLQELSEQEVLDLLKDRLQVERRAFKTKPGHPGPFCYTLFAKRPQLAARICVDVAAEPSSILTQVLSLAVAQVGHTQPENLVSTFDALVMTGSVTVRRGLAHALGWGRGRRSLVEGELSRLGGLATDEDVSVRVAAVRGAQMLADEHPDEALQVVSAARFEDAPLVAQEVCSTFGEHGFLKWERLTETQQEWLVEQLVRCPEIGDYHLTTFLAEVSTTDAERVVDLLRRRIERGETAGSGHEYSPLPFHWDSPLRISGHPQYLSLLRQVRDWIAAAPTWQRLQYGGNLFRSIAAEYDDGVLSVLEEAMHAGRREQIHALAGILSDAPRTLVWEKTDFVARALASASQFGEEAVREVGGALHSSVISGGRAGIPGKPFPEDVEQRDKSAAIAARLPAGSLEHRFYRSLQESADRSIDWSTERDETWADGRDW